MDEDLKVGAAEFDGDTPDSVAASVLSRVVELIEKRVKELCEQSQHPGDVSDVQAMALGGFGDMLLASAERYRGQSALRGGGFRFSQWRPISEYDFGSRPFGERVLLWARFQGHENIPPVCVEGMFECGGWQRPPISARPQWLTPTHWMPLPAEPEGE